MVSLEVIQHISAACYGLQVFSATPVRDAWKLETDLGYKCFKHVNLSVDKLAFVAAAVEHLVDNGFDATVTFINTINKTPFVAAPDGLFYLTDWINGHEGIANSLHDIQNAAAVLARLHRAAHGFVAPATYKPREAWGDIPSAWRARQAELKGFQLFAKSKNEEPFCKMYLDSCEWYIERCATALNILRNCDYNGLVDSSKRQGSLCHRDFTYHNFIIDESGKLYIIDFDYCSQEIRAYDIGRYARKVAKNFDWQSLPVKLMLRAYNLEGKMSCDELVFVLAFLYFPQRYWRLANRYFTDSQKNRQELTDQLRHELKYRQQEAAFLIQFSHEIFSGLQVREEH